VLLTLRPRIARIESGFWTVSLRKRNATMQATIKKIAGTAQGRKYGYSFKNSDFPNNSGKFSAGCERAPPINGPKILPVDQEMGTYAHAL
jgi:hypothetical protein